MHPTTKDVVRKTGPDAIKRSIRNLILTNYYDRPFRPGIGSNVQKILFDNISPITATLLQDAVIETIRNFEPRVEILDKNDVEVKVDPDGNGYLVNLKYTILNSGLPVTVALFLERVR